MESSQFNDINPRYENLESIASAQGATCDAYRVKLYGKLHFLKRLKTEHASDIRYREAMRKEFETGYRLEHPGLVRYLSYDDDGILMEYVDGETLTQRLACHPDFFNDRKNTDKFVRQLLDVVAYLHAHQVLHLDLKPDNILLTRINDDLKLVDLGCCYTDVFTDTQGHTDRFAAPEQLSGGEVDVRTDIFAIGRILELLPNHSKYNKVIARCTATEKSDRYQSIEEILQDISHKKKYLPYLAVFAFLLAAIAVAITFIHRTAAPSDSVSDVQAHQNDSIILHKASPQTEELPPYPTGDVSRESPATKVVHATAPNQQKDDKARMKEDMEAMIDQAYRSTIVTFCDSVFPSPSVGNSWAVSSTAFHQQIIQIGDQLAENYPAISESIIRQEADNSFQSLVSYVFNKMRENGDNER